MVSRREIKKFVKKHASVFKALEEWEEECKEKIKKREERRQAKPPQHL